MCYIEGNISLENVYKSGGDLSLLLLNYKIHQLSISTIHIKA